MTYLIELTDHKRNDIVYFPFVIWYCLEHKINDIVYFPFVIWYCLEHKINDYVVSHIERSYGKIKAVWECDSWQDAENWRKEILKMRGQEDLI